MRKHQFNKPTYPEKLAPNWLGRKCIFCGEISGLDDWQIKDIPRSMAKCKSSSIRASIWEIITGSYNCLVIADEINKEE